MIHAGIDFVAKGSDLPYPSSDRAAEKYQKVGEEIIDGIRVNSFNRETYVTTGFGSEQQRALRYGYEIIVYKPGSEEVCLINSNDDVVQDNYKNVNYLVSRTESRLKSALSSGAFELERQELRIEEDNARIQALFG